jgi:hypothetical protein
MSDDSRDEAGGTPDPQQQPAAGGPRGRFIRLQFPRDWTALEIVDYLKKLSEANQARKSADGG